MSNSRVSILVVDDDGPFRQVLANELKRFNYQVTTAASGEEALRRVTGDEPQVILLDIRLPGVDGIETLKRLRAIPVASEVIMMTGHGSIDTAIESIRLGAFDYIVKPCPLDEIDLRVQRAIERRSLRNRATLLERGLTPPDLGSSFVGESPEFRRLLTLIERVAPSDSTVLITGETGSGKERVAKLIHSRGPRRFSPFVIVDCAALQENLLQNELFGHERGAFTGADRAKPGLFEVAQNGTIFLDEIGEISPAVQVNLLRVLDSSTFRHIGGTTEVHVDVRVLAATNRDLTAMVRQGTFRHDLYYRLSTLTIEIAPLRQRGDDVERLANHFVGILSERFQFKRSLSSAAVRALRAHTWPGNIRELRHAIEAAMIVCDGPEILPEHLPPSVAPPRSNGGPETSPQDGRFRTLEELEADHIRRALQLARGHRGNAAKLLGISERNLYRKLHEHQLLGE